MELPVYLVNFLKVNQLQGETILFATPCNDYLIYSITIFQSCFEPSADEIR